MLVAASLGLETRLVTELTVYVPRSRARLCRVWQWPWYGNDNLVRGVAMTRVQAIFGLSSWIRILLLYHCTIENEVKS